MNERLLENWLDNANERAFQIPFCHSLAAEGYQVVHLSRHCAMEIGKDILAIAPDGVPCAFQLKDVRGKQMNLGKWRSDLEQQLVPLVHHQIVHPSISTVRPHRSFIVLNGTIAEEVARSIDDFNRGLRGRPKLKIIVRGQLLDRFKRLGSDFWPTEISVEFKSLLELLLADGRENLPKAKFAALLESALELNAKYLKTSAASRTRRLAGTAILCSYALSEFQKRDNHFAEFEGWTMLFAYVLAFAEKNNLPAGAWAPAAQLASTSMFNALGRLCDEISQRNRLVEGDILLDRHVHRMRETLLVGLMGLHALWRKRAGPTPDATDEFLRKFCLEHSKQMWMWGEAAAPQFLAAYFYLRTIDASLSTEGMLIAVIRGLCKRNHPRSERGLPSPYYDGDQVLLSLLGDEENRIREKFTGSSFALLAFLHLLVRCNHKQMLKTLWTDISRVNSEEFAWESAWRFFQWRAAKGITMQRFHKPNQAWSNLVAEASDNSAKDLPRRMRRFPAECVAFLLVYPHRLTASTARWLDGQMH